MLTIDCPWCGSRDETEFAYGGQAHVGYPGAPSGLSDTEWAEYVFFRANDRGWFAERWVHSQGCRRWFNAIRHTVTYAFAGPRSTGRPGMTVEVTAVDLSQPVAVTFDGRPLTAYAGDTLASALVRSRVRVAAHGVYTGRPRGLISSGAEEASVFVQVTSGPGETMQRATEIEVYDGLAAEPLAGRGRWPDERDDARYDKAWRHADVIVVGAGRDGVAAANQAAAAGRRTLLVDASAARAARDLDAAVMMLSRTTVTGLHGHGHLVALERRAPRVRAGEGSRYRLWHLRAAEIVLATGLLERPIALCGNDVPGVMLAGSAADYMQQFGVRPADTAVVFVAHDGGLVDALALLDGGVQVVAVVDVRGDSPLHGGIRARGVPVYPASMVTSTVVDPDGCLTAVRIRARSGDIVDRVDTHLLAVSGGWNPNLALYTHVGGRLRWSAECAAYVPAADPPGVRVVGAATGSELAALSPEPFFVASAPGDREDLVFLDLQRDATLADLRRAVGAGLRSPEHVKRYTTIGTAADQGRTSGVLTLGVLAQVTGVGMGDLQPTSYRPPYAPIPFGALGGSDRGLLADPKRVTAMHDWHVEHGAVFEDVGQWKRPWYFPHLGESMDEAVLRECVAARTGVAMMDASTLGKIELQGRDVGTFLDRIYTNLFSTLRVGKVRYGVMCTVDGMVFDDGTTARLSEDRWLMSTTTGNAAKVLDWLEEWLQTEWPELDVRCTSVTEQWCTVAIVGPSSRDVLGSLAPDLDVAADAFGFMELRDAEVAGIAARVMRISFSGELAYEVNVPGWYGPALWEAVLAAGRPYGIEVYGTETMHVLRAEKGYPIAGQDTDGTTTPLDLGMSWIVSKKKADFVGMRSLARPDTARPDRRHLVGLVPLDWHTRVAEGSQLVVAGVDLTSPPVPMDGFVTSSYRSAALGHPFALALLDNGRARHGETLLAVDDRVPTEVTVVGTVPYDPDGTRRDGDPHPTRRGGNLGGKHAVFPAKAATSAVGPWAARLAEAYDGPALTIREDAFRTLTEVRVGPAGRPALAAALGSEPPGPLASLVQGDRLVCWLGPDWYLVDEPAGGSALRDPLAADPAVSAVDISAQRTPLVVTGSRARDLLGHGCSLDLDPAVFRDGSAASSTLAKAHVHLVRRDPGHATGTDDASAGDDSPGYRLYVRASFARYLAQWLLDAGVEYTG
jgi:sarcosine oxidase subunit alpha